MQWQDTLVRVVQVILVALLGALADGSLLDQRVSGVGVELRQELVHPVGRGTSAL